MESQFINRKFVIALILIFLPLSTMAEKLTRDTLVKAPTNLRVTLKPIQQTQVDQSKPIVVSAPSGSYTNRLVVKFINHVPIRQENSLAAYELFDIELSKNQLSRFAGSQLPQNRSSQDAKVKAFTPATGIENTTQIQNPIVSTPVNTTLPTKRLVYAEEQQTGRDQQKMSLQGPTTGVISQELNVINNLLYDDRVTDWQRLFTLPVSQLIIDRVIAEKNSGRELADLANYYLLTLADEDAALAVQAELKNLSIVSTVYFPPAPENADVEPVTPDFEASQGYLESAAVSNGIDARYAWGFAGGRGELIKIVDIESGWNEQHEDLPTAFYTSGINYWDNDHGTAVLGEIVARDDGAGVTGIANASQFGFASVINGLSVQFDPNLHFANVAAAINNAASVLDAGDIILIEQHARGPGSDAGCTCNCSQWRYVPMENWQAEFDAIENATARGIIVVEAAGNGGQNLDHSRYDGRFDRTQRDSGAVMVGGGTSTTRAPMCWTNFGSRLDVQGWGQNVMTLGYGNIQVNGAADNNQWYATGFSGTSSASPIVVGAAAVLQGIQKSLGNVPFSPDALRQLLVSNGNAQTGTRLIGPLPDLRNTLDSLGLTPANQAAQTNEPDGTCTQPTAQSGECGGEACVNKPAGMVEGSCLFGLPFLCEDSYMTYHTDQFICAN